MPDKISVKAADNYRLAKSLKMTEWADGVYNLMKIPRYTFITDLWFWVTQAYAGGTTGAATIGFTGNGESADPDGFMDATAAGARATGMKRMVSDAQPGSQGKWFSDARGMLTITLAKGDDTTLLIAHIFVQYSIVFP